jgi:hypothetical protein
VDVVWAGSRSSCWWPVRQGPAADGAMAIN